MLIRSPMTSCMAGSRNSGFKLQQSTHSGQHDPQKQQAELWPHRHHVEVHTKSQQNLNTSSCMLRRVAQPLAQYARIHSPAQPSLVLHAFNNSDMTKPTMCQVSHLSTQYSRVRSPRATSSGPSCRAITRGLIRLVSTTSRSDRRAGMLKASSISMARTSVVIGPSNIDLQCAAVNDDYLLRQCRNTAR